VAHTAPVRAGSWSGTERELLAVMAPNAPAEPGSICHAALRQLRADGNSNPGAVRQRHVPQLTGPS